VGAPRSEGDPYAYPGTSVLRNHAHTTDLETLHALERRVALTALTKLQERPVRGSFDALHLSEIHSRIFGDVYAFAGDFRRGYVSKLDPRTGQPLDFPPPDTVVPLLTGALKRHVADENYMRDLPKKEFSLKAAELVIQLHTIHPFRDGNSRTTREFTRTLAMSAGYELNWSRIKKQELLPAIFAFSFDEKDRTLPGLVQRAIVNARPSPEIRVRYEARGEPSLQPWRGTIREAVERSATQSRSRPVFIDGSWEDAARVRPWSASQLTALLEQTRTAMRSQADPAEYGVRRFGAVYHVPSNKDVFIRLDEGRMDYPGRLQQAVDRYFGKSRETREPSRSRGPDLEDP
jgi:cell filamentation protein